MRIFERFILMAAFTAFFSSAVYAAYYGPYGLVAPIAVDGDTIRADVPVWPGVGIDAAIRVIGVDTPEMTGAKCPEEKAAALKAKAFTDAWLIAHRPIVIGNVIADKYSGRYDAIVTGKDGERLSDALIQAGLGRVYNGGARQSWCQ